MRRYVKWRSAKCFLAIVPLLALSGAARAADAPMCTSEKDQIKCQEDAEIAQAMATINDPNVSTSDYIRATEEHARLEREAGVRRLAAAGCNSKRTVPAFNACAAKTLVGLTHSGAMAAEWVGRKAILDAEQEAKDAIAAKNEAAEAKRRAVAAGRAAASCVHKRYAQGSVYIGMSRDEAIYCGWGEPERVNRTIRASGTSEQWVYGVGTYLYFDNGRLTAIQD